jgi:folylpolyglutamate synthase/dihydropteroate synthase
LQITKIHEATDKVSFFLLAFDHMRFLGNTLEEICEKKAGIFKSKKPALIGPSVPYSVASVSNDYYFQEKI